jgi:hypothetical protein
MKPEKKYTSLREVYIKSAWGKKLPPLHRQTINWLMEAIADAPPPAPDSAYVQLYVKDPSKNEQQFVGNIEVDYFNKIVKPVLSRGSESAIDTNRLIEKRLKDANITTENLNPIFDFIQDTQMKITTENFDKCQGIFKGSIAAESIFYISNILSESFNTTVENITNKSDELLNLMRLRAQGGSAGHGSRSEVSGPGEVVLAFFGNGRKMSIQKKKGMPSEKGDVSLGELRIELKGTEARIHPVTEIRYTSEHGTAKKGDFFKKNIKTDPKSAIKYIVFGEVGLQNSDFDNELDVELKTGIDPVIVAIGLALREYQVLANFNYYCFIDSNRATGLGLTCAGKKLSEIGKWFTTNIGNLQFDRGGHRLPAAFKI